MIIVRSNFYIIIINNVNNSKIFRYYRQKINKQKQEVNIT